MDILDLLSKHGIAARKVGNQNGGEYHSSCPTCGGGENDHHGLSDRLLLFPTQGDHGTWYCRGCAKGGDAIEFLIFHENLTFPAACELIGKELPERQEYATPEPRRQARQQFQPREAKSPADQWQEKARELVDFAISQLRTNDQQLQWLQARGIRPDTAHRHQLGWLPGENGKAQMYRSRKAWGIPASQTGKRPDSLWIPRGLVIPQIEGEQVHRLRVRRPEADRQAFLPKRSYHVIPESGQAPFLIYNGQRVITVIEAELDGILVEQEAGDLSGILALGSSDTKPDAKAHGALEQAELILVSLDFDKPNEQGRRAGGQAWIWWEKNYRHAIRWPVPVGKDPGDAFKEGLNIRDWIEAALPSVWTEGITGEVAGSREEAEAPAPEAPPPEESPVPDGQRFPASVVELGQILVQHRYVGIDLRDGGMRIAQHPRWADNFPEVSSRISQLLFHDDDVLDYLINHPDEKISGNNYWEGQ